MGLGVTRSLRAGLTVNRWLNGYHQSLVREVYTEIPNPHRELELDFRPRGWSFNLGLIWSPVEMLNVAAVYKTSLENAQVRLEKSRQDTWILGGAQTEVAPKGSEVTRNAFTSDDVRLNLPASYGLGLSWRPLDQLTVSADFTTTKWSQATIYDYFELQRTGPTLDGVPGQPPPPVFSGLREYPTLLAVPTSDDRDDPARLNGQQDSQQVRFGAEWVFIKGALRVPLRAGYFADRQIERVTSNHLPRFNGYTVGLGLAIGSVLLDVAYVYESTDYVVVNESAPGDTTSTSAPPARYASKTNRVFASVIYRFSRRH
jgi:long-subunit fatty acid transport protein